MLSQRRKYLGALPGLMVGKLSKCFCHYLIDFLNRRSTKTHISFFHFSTGENVAWILDSGIDFRHPDLNVQTTACFSAFSTLIDITCNDRNGHGTQ